MVTAARASEPANHQLLQRPKVVALLSVLTVFGWVAWTTFWDAGLYGDNVEQFVWVHSLQWGYHKHPPMPTWMLGAAIWLIGPHSWLTNALAAVSFAATGWLTWLIARNLCGEKIANTAIVLWTLQQCFSVSAQIYNHNTVLVMFLAATVYAVLAARLADSADSAEPSAAVKPAKLSVRQLFWWLAAGVFAGCAMLSKYQAALPLFFLLLTVCITNKQRTGTLIGKLAIAGLAFAGTLSPHLFWALTNNFPTVRYASAAIESGGLAARLAWVATFFVNQVRMVLPLLLAIGLAWAVYKIGKPARLEQITSNAAAGAHTRPGVWLWGLVWVPVFVLVLASLVSGSQLRNHWGVQLFQFLPIWLAWQWRGSPLFKLNILVPAAVAAHLVGLTYYALKQSSPNAVQAERRADSAYPARHMADAALAHWRQQTSCPLKIVGGDFEAGLASAFIKGFPLVYSGPEATPWVKPEQIRQSGILYMADMLSALPPDAVALSKWYLQPGVPGSGRYIQLAVKLPATPCE